MNAPVIVFGYNRIEKLARCLEAVEVAANGRNKELFIFVDGAKNSEDAEKVFKVQQFAKRYSSTAFSRIHTVCREDNKGLAASVIDGVTEVINSYGAVIVVEDDLVISSSFISFCDDVINQYENNQSIWSVGGWIPESVEGVAKTDAFLSFRAECWGWATWKDRWNKVDWNIIDYLSDFRLSFSKRRSFNKAGNDMAYMLDEYYEGKNHSWAIRFAYSQWKNRSYTVCPRYSLVRNDGLDGQGTNCHTTNIMQNLKDEKMDVPMQLVVDPKIIRKYYKAVGCHGIRRLVRCLKHGVHLVLNRN